MPGASKLVLGVPIVVLLDFSAEDLVVSISVTSAVACLPGVPIAVSLVVSVEDLCVETVMSAPSVTTVVALSFPVVVFVVSVVVPVVVFVVFIVVFVSVADVVLTGQPRSFCKDRFSVSRSDSDTESGN